MAISEDGASWGMIDPGFDAVPTRIDWAKDRFFGLTSSRSNQYFSGDGRRWTKYDMGTLDPPISVMYTKDGYVGRNTRGLVINAGDGEDWSRYSYEVEGHESEATIRLTDIRAFDYHDDLYWVIHEDSIQTGSHLKDLSEKRSLGETVPTLHGTFFSDDVILLWRMNRLYHLRGDSLVLIDGEKHDDEAFIGIFEHGGGFVGVTARGDIYSSSDGEHWEKVENGPVGNEVVRVSALLGNRVIMLYDGEILSLQLR